MTDADVLLVGGGLANGLCALALRRRHPRLRLALIEAGTHLGGNHTWCFHDSDVDDDALALLAPLVERSWPAVRVAFPDHERRLEGRYHAVRGGGLAAAVTAALEVPGSQLLLGMRAVAVTPHAVELADGRRLTAPLVLDARGPAPATAHTERTAWQVFLGQELEIDGPPCDEPVLMDARVPQVGGYRFMYLLPFGPRRWLVEDTAYADGPALDRAAARERIAAYVAERGARVVRVLREEEGCLPLPLEERSAPPLGSPLRLGYQGGWLHPTTGYSLPVAARVALTVAGSVNDAPAALRPLHARLRRQGAYCVLLNRLLFRAVPPAERWRVLSRFYRLSQPTIAHFNALDLTATDRARVLCGRPPRGLSLRAALLASQGG